MKVTAAEKRVYLKSKGWRRADRADGPNKSVELWIRPGVDGCGFVPAGVSLRAAWDRQKKMETAEQQMPEAIEEVDVLMRRGSV